MLKESNQQPNRRPWDSQLGMLQLTVESFLLRRLPWRPWRPLYLLHRAPTQLGEFQAMVHGRRKHWGINNSWARQLFSKGTCCILSKFCSLLGLPDIGYSQAEYSASKSILHMRKAMPSWTFPHRSTGWWWSSSKKLRCSTEFVLEYQKSGLYLAAVAAQCIILWIDIKSSWLCTETKHILKINCL